MAMFRSVRAVSASLVVSRDVLASEMPAASE
jgi:hypothetical protein